MASLPLPDTVVHVACELAPYARTGGLGEAVATLARFQAQAGLKVGIVVPLYREIAAKGVAMRQLGEPIDLVVGGRHEHVRFLEARLGPSGAHARIVFVEHPAYFDREGIYGDAAGDYADNERRFGLFSLAAVRATQLLASGSTVLHAHDWHAALAVVYLRSWFANDPSYRQVASVLSVHNAGFQGHFPEAAMDELGLPWDLYNIHQMEWYGRVNLLKGGMSLADMVTTVSPTHAVELRTPDGGFGLHEAFQALGSRFVGIVNGIDQKAWNPATDPNITAQYSSDDLDGKARCKAALQRLFGLPAEPRIPVFGMASRMVHQKGLDLILGSRFLALDAQFIFLGAGEARYEAALADYAAAHPTRVGVQSAFTDRREHKVLAGADLCLMPSLYEPCGLTQMRAQRYGSLPLARRVGGLADTIEDGVSGFLFPDYTPESFLDGAHRAIAAYNEPGHWMAMQRQAMARDFGWEASERKYEDLYRLALQRRHALAAPR